MTPPASGKSIHLTIRLADVSPFPLIGVSMHGRSNSQPVAQFDARGRAEFDALRESLAFPHRLRALRHRIALVVAYAGTDNAGVRNAGRGAVSGDTVFGGTRSPLHRVGPSPVALLGDSGGSTPPPSVML